MSAFCGPDQFVEFHLDCLGVPTLGVLNEKDHQEGDDRGAGVYDQLPCVAEVKQGPVTIQTAMTATANVNALGRPQMYAALFANREYQVALCMAGLVPGTTRN